MVKTPRFKQGKSRFCQVLCRALVDKEMNPSGLHRRLVGAGYEVSLDLVYKLCAGERKPTGPFLVWAAKCITDNEGDEEALRDAFMHAHWTDLGDTLIDDVKDALAAIESRA
jgi:hypothetical protein